MFSIRYLGMIPRNAFTNNFYIIGAMIDALLMSLALADRYNYILKKNNKLEMELHYKNSDLTKVVKNNKLRYLLKLDILKELKNVHNNNSKEVKQKLKSFITDLNL